MTSTSTTSTPLVATTELVVLLDADGRPCGTAPKAEVHHADTPLHLAFSCWFLDARGRTLLTRRALTKRTWPGVWTNSVCGHPGPDEDPAEAVHRRAADELGVRVADVRPLLPDFRYRAVMADGTVENEVCPVYGARMLGDVVADPAEVEDWRWVPLEELRAQVAADPSPFSPWMLEQLALLEL
ncbi:isopentenyl-diphosphate Delta-isomerase [Kineococcus sp. NUM-3379]